MPPCFQKLDQGSQLSTFSDFPLIPDFMEWYIYFLTGQFITSEGKWEIPTSRSENLRGKTGRVGWMEKAAA